MDSTSIWVFWQKHQHRAGYILVIVLAFVLGWQIGRATSPYYHSSPIVFQEIKGEGIPVSDISTLEKVKQAGIDARPVASTKETAGTVAAATTSNPSAAAGPFVASKNSTLYHYITCPAAKQILPANRREFKTAQEAESAGFKPSKCTLEQTPK